MKLALLGVDDEMLVISRRAAETGRHEIVLFADIPADAMCRLHSVLPRLPAETDWESLLGAGTADAVIVSRGPDQELRAEQLRKLVQAGIPLLIAHPVLDSMLVYYELDMIRRESGCVMLPNMPWRWHPATARLTELVRRSESPLGQIEQATFERTNAKRDKGAVLAAFARDVDLIRMVCGDVVKISAHGSPDDEATYSHLGVQMSGEGPQIVRWSVGPVEDSPGGRLTVLGTQGKATLSMPDDRPWQLELRTGTPSTIEVFDDWNAAEAGLERLEAAIGGETQSPTWEIAARSVELTEAIDRSLRRGRTIELHNEDFTDIGTFKGTMTSLGCGLLVASLLALLGVAVLQTFFRNLVNPLKIWPSLLLGFLVVFLLLQLVLKLATAGDSSRRP